MRVDTSAQSSSRDNNTNSRESSRASTPVTDSSRKDSRVKSLSLGESPVNPIPTDMVSREQIQNALLTQRTPLSTPREHAPLAPLSSSPHPNLTPLHGSLGGGLSLGGGALLGSRSLPPSSATLSSSGGFGGPGSPVHMLSLKDGDGDGMGVGMGMGTPHASRRSSTGIVAIAHNTDPIPTCKRIPIYRSISPSSSLPACHRLTYITYLSTYPINAPLPINRNMHRFQIGQRHR